jgi:hypothetical protein
MDGFCFHREHCDSRNHDKSDVKNDEPKGDDRSIVIELVWTVHRKAKADGKKIVTENDLLIQERVRRRFE